MTRLLILTASVALLTGCASHPIPPLAADNPASPDAREGVRIEHDNSLREDEATRKSHAILSEAHREQEHWDKYGPVSGTPEDPAKPDTKPKMTHEHQ